MTENEIIKALEKAANADCNRCSCNNENCDGEDCDKYIAQKILNIINRLQADNEALIAGQETLQKALAEKIAEIERLKEEHKKVSAYIGSGWGYVSFLEFVKNQRAEAIKEFAERLKEEFIQSVFFEREYQGEKFVKEIDNLVKETVGDTE